MAMNPTQLGEALANIVTDPTAGPEAKAGILAMWTAIAGAIISHISSNATVQVMPGIPVTGALGAGATSGPGQGLIS